MSGTESTENNSLQPPRVSMGKMQTLMRKMRRLILFADREYEASENYQREVAAADGLADKVSEIDDAVATELLDHSTAKYAETMELRSGLEAKVQENIKVVAGLAAVVVALTKTKAFDVDLDGWLTCSLVLFALSICVLIRLRHAFSIATMLSVVDLYDVSSKNDSARAKFVRALSLHKSIEGIGALNAAIANQLRLSLSLLSAGIVLMTAGTIWPWLEQLVRG